MGNLQIMVTITSRKQMPEYLTVYRELELYVNALTLGHGTAGSEIRNMFGLESSEKAILFTIITDETWLKMRKALKYRIHIDIPNKGIAFTVPMSSIGGKRELQFLTENQSFEKGEESALKDTTYELVVVVANQGYNEMVMDAARSAGATGGTVIHAKGSGMERAEQFLGISLATEKDMIFIVAKTERKNEIMQAVMRKAGLASKAKAVVFSVPVTDTVGLRLETEEETAS